MEAPLRVLVVDDHEIFRRALCHLLETQDDIDIVCEASHGADAIRFAREHRPDVVILDIAMPVMNGFEVALVLKNEFPDMQIVILSQSASQAFKKETFAIGATAYVTKDTAAQELIPQLRKIMVDKRDGKR